MSTLQPTHEEVMVMRLGVLWGGDRTCVKCLRIYGDDSDMWYIKPKETWSHAHVLFLGFTHMYNIYAYILFRDTEKCIEFHYRPKTKISK